MEITENMKLEMKNVLSFRGSLTQKSLNEKIKEMEKLVKEFGAHALHPPITTSFGADKTAKEPSIDIEILVPLDKDVSHEVLVKALPGYRFKPVFTLTHAVKLHHVGNTPLEDSIKELYSYLKVRDLDPLTTLYSITMSTPDKPDETFTDLMVGINPNKL